MEWATYSTRSQDISWETAYFFGDKGENGDFDTYPAPQASCDDSNHSLPWSLLGP